MNRVEINPPHGVDSIETQINNLEYEMTQLAKFEGNELRTEQLKSQLQDLYDVQIQKLAA